MSTAPISSAMPDRALESTDRVTGSSLIRPPPVEHQRPGAVDPARPSPAGRGTSPRSNSTIAGPSTRCCPRPGARGPAPGPRSTRRRRRSSAARHSASSSGSPARVSSGLSTCRIAITRTATSSTGSSRHRVAVALLVRLVEALGQRVEVVRLDGQLERLAAVAQVGAAAQLGALQRLGGRLLQLGEGRLDVVALEPVERPDQRADEVAPHVGDGQARARSARRPRAG